MIRSTLVIATALGLGLLLPACIQIGADAPPPVRRHALDVLPPGATPTDAMPSRVGGALAVREFAARRRYDVRVVRRGPEGGLTFLESDRWVEEPSEAVTTVFRETLARSGAFESVTSASAAFETELVLEGALLMFDVAVGADGAEVARMEVRLDLAESVGGALIHSGRFATERPIGTGDEGLGVAMSGCTSDLVTQALAAWRRAD